MTWETQPLLTARRNVSLKILLALILLVGGQVGFAPDLAVAAEDTVTPHKAAHPEKTPTSPLKRLQRFISRADGDRCPMYPTCSHYASQAFAREGLLTGWVLTCDRLMRCGRDEARLTKTMRVNGQKHAYDPLDANTFWWKER
jgi:uncharacterized protein